MPSNGAVLQASDKSAKEDLGVYAGGIKPAIKHTNFSLHFVIPAQAGIHYHQQLFWIPALRYAAAGMTYLIAGLIITICLFILCSFVKLSVLVLRIYCSASKAGFVLK